MAFTAFRGMRPFSQLMFSAFVILVSFLVFLIVSLIVAVPLFGLDSMMSLPTLNELNNPESIRLMKYFQVVQSIGLFIVPPLILGWLYQGGASNYLYLDKPINGTSVLLVLLLTFAAAPFINFIGEMNMKMILPDWLSGVEQWMKETEEKAAQLTEAFLQVKGIGGLMFNLFMIGLLPAVGEELLFRGVIQRIFTRMTLSHHGGIWISAILFSSLHLQFYGFVPRLLLGVLFGYLLVWSGSMWLPIIGHFLNNTFAVLAMYLVDKNLLTPEVENFGADSGSYYFAVLSLALIFVFMYLIKKENKQNELRQGDLKA